MTIPGKAIVNAGFFCESSVVFGVFLPLFITVFDWRQVKMILPV